MERLSSSYELGQSYGAYHTLGISSNVTLLLEHCHEVVQEMEVPRHLVAIAAKYTKFVKNVPLVCTWACQWVILLDPSTETSNSG